MTGLKPNQQKPQAYVTGFSDDIKEQILVIIRFNQGHFPVKHLSVPLTTRRWTAAECATLRLERELNVCQQQEDISHMQITSATCEFSLILTT